MARKIKETPILSGKDAEKFEKALKANKSKKIPRADYEKAMNSYRLFTING